MSIYSDYKCGALSDDEFRSLAAIENRRDRYEREHEFDDYESRYDDGDDEYGSSYQDED